MFFPLQNTCARVEVSIASRKERSAYGIRTSAQLAPNTTNLGSIHAISTVTGRTLWKFEQRAATLSLLTTGGGVLFGGDAAGRFRAFDQQSGQILWEVNLGSQVTGFPVSFAVNGRQYIAVSTGQSVSSGAQLSLTPEIRVGQNNNLYVFALPRAWQAARVAPQAAAAMSPAAPANAPPAVTQACRRPEGKAPPRAPGTSAEGTFSAAQSAAGRRLFTEQQCAVCHGETLRGTPGAPALAGADFQRAWRGRSVQELLDCTRGSMPPGRLGSLSDEQHLALIATILEANGFKPAQGGGTLNPTAPLDRISLGN
jgi:alcohol dehydrogenase (cytochrome c)